jgi:DNA-directed RNA polymerase subunit RPC12/RpoP
MPLYSYKCTQCKQELDILIQERSLEPKMCGHRCLLGPSISPEERGCGKLQRQLKPTQGLIRSSVLGDMPNLEEAGKAGFTILKNEGNGKVRKIAGPSIHQNKHILKK